MNTPKEIKRYAPPTSKFPDRPAGSYTGAILSADHLQALGAIVVAWTNIEEWMIGVFAGLLSSDHQAPARLIYQKLSGAEKRRQVMVAMLQKSERNAHRGEEFDHLLDEFDQLRQRRNKFVHGRWWTHDQTGAVYIQNDDSEFGVINTRVVELGEMHELLTQLDQFFNKVTHIRFEVMRDNFRSPESSSN